MSYDIEKHRPRHNIDDVVERLGVSRRTFERWMHSGKIEKARMHVVNGEARRLWFDADIVKFQDYKRKNYREGCGRRKPKDRRTGTSRDVVKQGPVCPLLKMFLGYVQSWRYDLRPAKTMHSSSQLPGRFRAWVSSQ
jgi:predicted DNA-binding transcriptional regulator AlpA